MKAKIKYLREQLRLLREFIFKKRKTIRLTLTTQDWEIAEAQVRSLCNNRYTLSHYLIYLAKLLQYTHPKEALRLGEEAIGLLPTPFRKKWLAITYFHTGNIHSAYALSKDLPYYAKVNPYNHHKLQLIEGNYRLTTKGIEIPLMQPNPAYEPIPNRMVYIAASALPFHNTGYTLRTQHILKNFAAAGWEVICLTRPGYPDDRNDRTATSHEQAYTIEGVHYETIAGPHRRKTAPDNYLYASAKILEDKIRQLRPLFIQAASNYENALPALIAAQRLGIRFVYEVRGLWELTTASKIVDYENSERFALEQSLENIVTRDATLIFTLGKSLARELVLRGAQADKIQLAPNGVDTTAFETLSKDLALAKKLSLPEDAFIIGYAGSIVAYEGLDDLVSAVHYLRDKMPTARLLIIGDGDALPLLRQQVKDLALTDRVYFIGKIPHSEMQNYYSLFDVMALPRKPFKVCQLVTPLKPLEAMAMGIPLIISDVDALQEMVQPNVTALVHRTNDPIALAETILQLATDPSLRKSLTIQAQAAVLRERTWFKVTQDMMASYAHLLKIDIAYLPARNRKLIPYEVLMNRYAAIPAADKILTSGWKLGVYPNIKLNHIPWSLKKQKQRSWNFHIHCWDMLDCLLQAYSQSNDNRYLQAASTIALEWISIHSDPNNKSISSFAWYDMAVGFRAYRLAYIIDASDKAGILAPLQKTLLWQSLEQHQVYLANDAHIAFHTNHGFYQIAGQLAMGRRFAQQSPMMAAAYEQGKQRLQNILLQQFSTEGVHREHSPAYHLTIYGTLKGMINAQLIENPETVAFIHKIEESLSWFILPNKHLCNFGDSDYKILKHSSDVEPNMWETPVMQYIVSLGAAGELPEADYKVFPESGYFIVRKLSTAYPTEFSQSSYLVQTAAFHSRTHKHADDLNFIWSDRGADILVDAGYYGYIGKTMPGSKLRRDGHWYSDPNRIYCESTRAHNTLEFDGLNDKRVGVKPYGSAIKNWIHTAADIFAVESSVKQFDHIEHIRILVFKPNTWLVVFDGYRDATERKHTVKQWFHLSPALKLLKNHSGYTIPILSSTKPLQVVSLFPSASVSRIYHGEKKPCMQGWWSGEHLSIIPNAAFCYKHVKQASNAFATLFSFNDEITPMYPNCQINAAGKQIDLQWQDEDSLHTLNITRNTDALEVNYEKS